MSYSLRVVTEVNVQLGEMSYLTLRVCSLCADLLKPGSLELTCRFCVVPPAASNMPCVMPGIIASYCENELGEYMPNVPSSYFVMPT